MTGDQPIAAEFVTHAAAKLGEFLAQIRRCVAMLDEAELWHRANPHTNSVGNLVLHLTGNVRQWILGGLAGRPVERNRAAEFAARGPLLAGLILPPLEAAVDEARAIIRQLTPEDLVRRRTVQEYEISGLAAVFHVVEHFSGHAAQIVHITKTLRGVPLDRYDAAGHKLPGFDATP
jgi:hypothetical protein